jgi:hypothetical protein
MMMASCSVPTHEAKGESTMVPNWLELPSDVTVNILQRLDTIDIVKSACLVCPLWWNIFKEPRMWRTIRMVGHGYRPWDYHHLVEICCHAIRRSCGHLENIYINSFGFDDLLRCLAWKYTFFSHSNVIFLFFIINDFIFKMFCCSMLMMALFVLFLDLTAIFVH